MHNVLGRLTEWRQAERQRDVLPVGSPEWQLAVEDVERAHTAYRAELAQATAWNREADLRPDRDGSSRIAGSPVRSTE